MTQPPADSSPKLRQAVVTIAFALMSLTLWALTHRYKGFARDGELYAVQAMARLHPSLADDLFLQNTSQDRFTIFSSVYAEFIGWFGLQTAELILFSLCTAGLLAAAWHLVRGLATQEEAWFSVVLLIVTVGYYGAYQIFSYSETYLTARSLAEVMVVAALACELRGRHSYAMTIAAAAFFVHPLMALPGALLLLCLWMSSRAAILGSIVGILAVLSIALAATLSPIVGKHLTVMDSAWLEVVRERSQFLFLKYWTVTDWEIAGRPFLCLTMTMLALPHPRIRALGLGAMLVGASGLGVALIAGTIGPVALLLQGQAWRWMWITGFTSVLLLGPTVWQVWRDDRCGPLSATLLILSWTFPGVDGLGCAGAALVLWLIRPYITSRIALLLKWAAVALGIVIIGWVVGNCWTYASSPITESGRESLTIARLRQLFALDCSPLLAVAAFYYAIRRSRANWMVGVLCALLLFTSIWIIPGSVKQLDTVGKPAEIAAFSDWRAAIPEKANVLIVPSRKSASFIWFTLGRNSYSSVDQSSGVVFSRATSMEVVRRSQVLLPLQDPDWKLLTAINEGRNRSKSAPATPAASGTPIDAPPKPLTSERLEEICQDSQLGFVIAQEDVGFDPLRHARPGTLKDWNLYDCRHVRDAVPAG